MSEVATLLDDIQSLFHAIRELPNIDSRSVHATPAINLISIQVYDADVYRAPQAGLLLTAVLEWLVVRPQYRIRFDLNHMTLVEVGTGSRGRFALVETRHQVESPALEQAARDIGLQIGSFHFNEDPGLPKCPPFPARAFAFDAAHVLKWSFDDVRTACEMQAARPAIAAALGDLAADRVLAFAAPALPLQQRLVEEETRLRLKRQRVDPEGDRPTTEAPEPPPTAASLEANLVLRCAERRGQDDVASNEPWNVNRTLYTTRSGILAPARNWWTAGLDPGSIGSPAQW
jgi:hypothetical protein